MHGCLRRSASRCAATLGNSGAGDGSQRPRQWHSLCVRSPAFRRKSAHWCVRIPPEGGTTNEQHVLVPRLLPRNTLPREIVTGGRSLQCIAFQGWSPGTRIHSLMALYFTRSEITPSIALRLSPLPPQSIFQFYMFSTGGEG